MHWVAGAPRGPGRGRRDRAREAEPDWDAIRATLLEAGFALLEDPRAQLVEQIKTHLVTLIHYPPPGPRLLNYSDSIVEQLGRDYHYLSHLFSARKASLLRSSSSARRWSGPRSSSATAS